MRPCVWPWSRSNEKLLKKDTVTLNNIMDISTKKAFDLLVKSIGLLQTEIETVAREQKDVVNKVSEFLNEALDELKSDLHDQLVTEFFDPEEIQ